MFESPWHWAVVAVVALVLFFGWKNLPDMARSLSRSLRVFKTEIKGMTEDDKARSEASADETPSQPRELPRADVVRNELPRPRPRPTPGGDRSQVGGPQ
ncbi:MAG: Sec-independent protein translocase subunit TatA [Actinobacteria bacterium]|nr:Sec-independent protein translocase subunit TatA [Actinomycetota bacterium]